MAAPLPTAKQSVSLSAPGIRVSRIRRDPPPKVKEITLEEQRDRDRRAAFVGIIVFALAIFVAVLAIGNLSGHSPRDQQINVML
jgi:hypothetical protein